MGEEAHGEWDVLARHLHDAHEHRWTNLYCWSLAEMQKIHAAEECSEAQEAL